MARTLPEGSGFSLEPSTLPLSVIVRPEHRGHGYGTRVVNYVKEFALKKDFKRITLLTDRVSAESQRCFERNGFVHSSMIPMRLLLGDEGKP